MKSTFPTVSAPCGPATARDLAPVPFHLTPLEKAFAQRDQARLVTFRNAPQKTGGRP